MKSSHRSARHAQGLLRSWVGCGVTDLIKGKKSNLLALAQRKFTPVRILQSLIGTVRNSGGVLVRRTKLESRVR